jgi:hypothetical protein
MNSTMFNNYIQNEGNNILRTLAIAFIMLTLLLREKWIVLIFSKEF